MEAHKRDEFPHIPNEPYFTPQEVADILKISDDLVRKIFIGEPDVIVIVFPKPGRRVYRTLRIPRASLIRFLRNIEEAAAKFRNVRVAKFR